MHIWVDVENSSLAKTGEGPLYTATSWRHTKRLNRAGQFDVVLPVTDERVLNATIKKVLRCHGVVNEAVIDLGHGIVDKRSIQLNNKSKAVLTISGDDLLRELTYTPVGSLAISGQNGPNQILALASGWSFDLVNGYDTTAIAVDHTFEGGTVLAALIWLAETTGEHFRLGAGRKIVWMRDLTPSSGIYAVQAGDPVKLLDNHQVALILDLEEVEDSYKLVSRVRPYGAGSGDSKITLSGTTWSPPSGYTLDAANNYIKRDSAETAYGTIYAEVSFKDISTADTLAQAAYAWLVRNSESYKAYKLRIAKLDQALEPGETIHVSYHRWMGGIHVVDIETDLIVLEATTSIDKSGIRVIDLVVATADRWPRDDNAAIIDGLGQSVNSFTYSQPADPGSVGTLTPDQYPDALLRDGSRSLLGDLTVAAGKKIDGVDLDVHAANADAHHTKFTSSDHLAIGNSSPHHEPVTISNTGLLLSGQDLALNLAAQSGLEIISGLAIDPALAGGGLTMSASRVMSIGAADTSIQVNTSDIQVKRAVDSGLEVVSGLKLGTPQDITVISLSELNGAVHSHAADASSDVSGGIAKLLKSTAAGGLTLASLATSGAVDVGQGLTSGATSLRAIHHTHGGVDHTHLVINPSGSWNLDEQFGLDVDDNVLVRGWIVGKHALQLPEAMMLLHFDGAEPFETNYVGDAVGHMGQVPTMAGGVIFRPGKFGKGVSVGDAATNLLKNPSFEINVTDDWNLLDTGTGGTRGWASNTYYIGQHGCNLTASTGIVYIRSGTNVTVANGQTVFFQARVYKFSATPVADIAIFDATNSVRRATYSFTDHNTWELGVVSWTNNTGAAVNVRAEVRNLTGNSSSSFVVDACQLELDHLTQYLDGSLGDGHSWSGAAHNSTSSRTKGTLYYSLDMPDVWTVSFWFSPTLLPTEETSVFSNLFQWRYDDNNRVLVSYNPSTGYLYAALTGNGSSTSVVYTTAITRDTWYQVAITCDGTYFYFYINGSLVGSNTVNAFASGSTPNTFRVGYGGGLDFPGVLDDFAIAKSCYDAALIRAIYESEAPVFAESSTWHWRAAENLLWADSEGLWMYDADGGTVMGFSGVDGKSWGGVTLNKGDHLFGRYGAADGGWAWFDRDGVSSKPYLKLGYADVTVWQFDAGGATLNGVLDISITGGIYQGTGSFAAPTTGLKIWNENSIGRIGGYNGSTIQWYADTDGRLYAGGGNVTIDTDGIKIAPLEGETWAPGYGLTFDNSSGYGYTGRIFFSYESIVADYENINTWVDRSNGDYSRLRVGFNTRTLSPMRPELKYQAARPGSSESATFFIDSIQAELTGVPFTIEQDLILQSDVYTDQWQSYYSSSTIVGWSSLTTTQLYYTRVGNRVFVQFQLVGSADASGSVSFTVPYTSITSAGFRQVINITDGGTNGTGYLHLNASANTVNVYSDQSGGGWATSGTKAIRGEFWYQAA